MKSSPISVLVRRRRRVRCAWRCPSAFTLIELLVVMVILGLLVALIGPRVIQHVGRSKQGAAKVQIEMLASALSGFRLNMGRYPTTAEGLEALVKPPSGAEKWKGPYLTKRIVPKDPWDKDYIYRSPGQKEEFEILSYGKDGVAGGKGEDADVVSWE